MNPLRKAWQWVKNRYEAAVTVWTERSILFGGVQDARFDCDSATRVELVRRHRYWVRNSELVQRIRNLFIQFSVGPTGLQCIPNSNDEQWNDVRAINFTNWSRRPEISSRHSLQELAIQWAGSLFDDGEFFILKRRFEITPKRWAPYIQTVEAHRCMTPPNMREQEGKTIVDGVEIDADGCPTFYWFLDDPQADSLAVLTHRTDLKFKKVPADMVIHGFKARRPGMYRGIPEGFSGMNTLHDYEDLHLLEMKTAKKLASTAVVITNETGEANPAELRRQRFNITQTDAAGNDVTKQRANYYETKIGGETLYARKGEKIDPFKCDRPSIVTQQYWDLLLSQICCGYNVPKLLVVPYSLQGTVTRADLDVCTSAFRFNFEIIASALREIYEWHTEWVVKYDHGFVEQLGQASISNATPPEYQCVVIRPPRPPNVDIGYNANALAIELELGVKDYQDVLAEQQKDWRQVMRQAAEVEAYKDALAKEFKISPDRIGRKLKDAAGAVPVDGEDAGTDFENLKQEVDAYGVGVRAGAITPTLEDEEYFRKKAGLPPMPKSVRDAWSAEKIAGTRRPITLTQPDGERAAPGFAATAETADAIDE